MCKVHPFIVGSTGIIRAENLEVLQVLGISAVQSSSLLKSIAIESAKLTAGIMEVRRPHLRDPAVPVPQQPPPADDGGGDDGASPGGPPEVATAAADQPAADAVAAVVAAVSAVAAAPPPVLTGSGREVRLTERALANLQQNAPARLDGSNADVSEDLGSTQVPSQRDKITVTLVHTHSGWTVKRGYARPTPAVDPDELQDGAQQTSAKRPRLTHS